MEDNKLVRLLTYVSDLVDQACFTDVSRSAYFPAPH